MRRVNWYVTLLAALAAVEPAPDAVRGAIVYAATPRLAAQVNRDGNVTVTVAPRSLSASERSWDFDVTLETHVQALDQDLAKVAALIDTQGKPHAPIGWEGDPPGGHHRRGVLRFRPLADDSSVVVLRVRGIGGVDARDFRWQRER